MTRTRIALLLLLLLVAAAVSAQSLLDDPAYRSLIEQVSELKEEAQIALDDGRYDDAVDLSAQAETLADEAEEYAAQRVLAYRANGWVRRARQRVLYVGTINAEVHYPQEWDLANEYLDDAQASFEAEQWVQAIAASRLVMDTLQDVMPVRVAEEPEPAPRPQPVAEPEPEPEPAPAAEPEPEPAMPRYYVVRLIPERRDCFWRIAEYEFVYGDPWQWPVLYEANRDKLPDPDNPDLILPGMIVEIPSLEGEEREGYWNPDDLPRDE